MFFRNGYLNSILNMFKHIYEDIFLLIQHLVSINHLHAHLCPITSFRPVHYIRYEFCHWF